ncbi:hypothetical protein BJ546DRAFT_271785 [Cryomyces antarcticus]
MLTFSYRPRGPVRSHSFMQQRFVSVTPSAHLPSTFDRSTTSGVTRLNGRASSVADRDDGSVRVQDRARPPARTESGRSSPQDRENCSREALVSKLMAARIGALYLHYVSGRPCSETHCATQPASSPSNSKRSTNHHALHSYQRRPTFRRLRFLPSDKGSLAFSIKTLWTTGDDR